MMCIEITYLQVGGGAATGVQELTMPSAPVPTSMSPSQDCEAGGTTSNLSANPTSVAETVATAENPTPPSAVKKKETTAPSKARGYFRGRPYFVEAACFLYFGAMAAYAGLGSMWVLTAYCSIMGLAFAVLSLGGAMPVFGM